MRANARLLSNSSSTLAAGCKSCFMAGDSDFVKNSEHHTAIDNALQIPQHPPMTINQAWFQQKLRERKISQRQLAKKMDMDPASISNLFAGKRRMTPEEAKTIAGYLLVPVTEVLRQAGVDVQDDVRKLPIAGFINGQSVAYSIAEGAEDYMPAPADVSADAYALQARTQMTSASYADGWLFIVDGTRHDPANMYGKLCLSATKSGELFLGIVTRGYKLNHHNVSLLLATQSIENRDVIWASPILWIKPT